MVDPDLPSDHLSEHVHHVFFHGTLCVIKLLPAKSLGHVIADPAKFIHRVIEFKLARLFDGKHFLGSDVFQLGELILDRDTYRVKEEMGNLFAQIVYEGKWFTPLREAVQAFIESTQKYVTGEVKFKLYKGNIIKAGTTAPYSLYNESIASFTTGDMYDHHDAEGFINLFGLSSKVRAMKIQQVTGKNII